MAKARSRRVTKLLVLAVASVGALCVLELGVRVFKPFGNRLRGNLIVLPVLMRFQWTNTVNKKLTPTITNTCNSLGFRGPEPAADFAARQTVIAVGGSTTECKLLNDGESWPEALLAELLPRLPDVWINNAGQDGHSTFGHAMLVEQHLRELKPKFCLFLVGINDIGRVDLSPYDATIDAGSSGFWRRRTAQSELISLVRALLRTRRAYARGVTHAHHDLQTIPECVVSTSQGEAELEFHRTRCLPAYRDRITRLLQLTRAIPSEPILMTQPALYGDEIDKTSGVGLGARAVDTDYLDGVGIRHLNAKVCWQVLELYNDVTREVARSTKTELIELARAMPKDSALYYDWMHYTAQGARVVAKLVSSRLAEILGARR